MAQLVQSACPGCKNVLRIPAEWLHQPIRCKHCGLVMQARQPPVASRVAVTTPPAPTKRTPPPPTRNTPAKPAAPVARLVTPPAGGSAAPLAIPLTRAPAAVAVAQVPAAIPLTRADQFAFFQHGPYRGGLSAPNLPSRSQGRQLVERPRSRPRRPCDRQYRRRRLLGQHSPPAFPPDDEPIAQGEKVGDPVVVTPPKPPDRSKPTTPAKARQISPVQRITGAPRTIRPGQSRPDP